MKLRARSANCSSARASGQQKVIDVPLSTCPDCGARVSLSADACPRCGCPFDTPRTRPRTQTIQQTGKVWKIQLLISSLIWSVLTVVGCAGFWSNEPDFRPSGLFVVGFLWFAARVLAWWFHG